MSTNSTKILDKALKLSNAERADMAACLIASLNEAAGDVLNAEWGDEIDRRIHSIDQGEGVMIPWENARKKIFRHE